MVGPTPAAGSERTPARVLLLSKKGRRARRGCLPTFLGRSVTSVSAFVNLDPFVQMSAMVSPTLFFFQHGSARAQITHCVSCAKALWTCTLATQALHPVFHRLRDPALSQSALQKAHAAQGGVLRCSGRISPIFHGAPRVRVGRHTSRRARTERSAQRRQLTTLRARGATRVDPQLRPGEQLERVEGIREI